MQSPRMDDMDEMDGMDKASWRTYSFKEAARCKAHSVALPAQTVGRTKK